MKEIVGLMDFEENSCWISCLDGIVSMGGLDLEGRIILAIFQLYFESSVFRWKGKERF